MPRPLIPAAVLVAPCLALAFAACSSSTPQPTPTPPGPSAADTTAPAQTSAPANTPKTDAKGRSYQECPTVGGAAAAAGPASEGQKRHDDITAVIVANRPKFRCCYDVARGGNPTLRGDYGLEALLNVDGSVKSVAQKHDASTFTDEGMTECMVTVFKSLHFPPSGEKKETTVPYKFGFTPGGGT